MLRQLSPVILGAALLSGCGGAQLDAEMRARLPHSTAPQVSELGVSRREAPYVVSGQSAAELANAMRAHAAANWNDPQAVGMTSVSMPLEASCQEYSDGGALRDAKISLSLVVHLPHWEDSARAPSALQQSWTRFSRALRAHEEGHVRIATEHAMRLRKALVALTPEESCRAFMGKLQDQVEGATARMDREQADYDAKTQHGITQGCVL